VRSRKVVFRPTVWLFREFSVRIINMNGHLCMIEKARVLELQCELLVIYENKPFPGFH
jgi:hypothetical protein